jgi:hypothetical protein
MGLGAVADGQRNADRPQPGFRRTGSVQAIRNMSDHDLKLFKASLRERLPSDDGFRIVYAARANAAKARVPN